MTRSKSDLAVLVPVLARPHRVIPTLEAFADHRVLFLPDPGDTGERDAIEVAGGEQLPVEGGYAEKISAGVAHTTEPLIFLGADDLEPFAGWFERAKAYMPPAQVVGINDMVSRPHRPEHATHFLMTRDYAVLPCADGSTGPLFHGYMHWYCDDELIATAKKRGVYAYAPDAHVEHLHPDVKKAPDDDTYRRGRSRSKIDRRIFRERTPLWT